MFKNLFLKAATWLFRQSLGGTKGTAAVAHAGPILATLADAAGQAAVIGIDKAADANGNAAKVAALVQAVQKGGTL